MKIQFNTDKTIKGEERKAEYFSDIISDELKHFSDHVTRVEVHLSDENGSKDGAKDIRCLLEARIEGKQPIAVSCQADNIEQAVSGATDKLKASLKTIVERASSH